MYENRIQYESKNDTIGHYYNPEVIIYDFKKNGELLIKNYNTFNSGTQEYKKTWVISSDSILTIDSLKYPLIKITKNYLQLIDSFEYDYSKITFKKAKKTNINYTKEQVKNILLSNVWSVKDTSEISWQTHFEYFDNKTMVYRYKYNKNESNSFFSEFDNLHSESWGIDKYKDYYFLYLYYNWSLNNGSGGSNNKINQLLELSTFSYTISDFESNNNKRTYLSKKYDDNKDLNSQRIIGDWVSYNSEDKLYDVYLSNKRMKKYDSLYVGSLNLTIKNKNLAFKIDSYDTIEYDWKLSKDGKILVLEYQIDEPDRKGVHVEYADILELTDKKLKIRLFDNSYFTGQEDPYKLLLNKIQGFERK